jgi:hypothetical protein
MKSFPFPPRYRLDSHFKGLTGLDLALAVIMQLKKGSATVPVAPVGVPPTGPTAANGSLKSYLPLRPTISTIRLKTLGGTPALSKPTAWLRLNGRISWI